MTAERHFHSRRENGGGRPISGRLQAERWGHETSSLGARLAEPPRQQQREEATEDRRIRSLVQKRLAIFGPLVEESITVSVHNGRVMLSGNVGSDYERQAILHEVGRIAFVKHLRSSVTVGDEWEEVEEEGAARAVPLVRPQLVGALAALSAAAVAWWVWNWMQL